MAGIFYFGLFYRNCDFGANRRTWTEIKRKDILFLVDKNPCNEVDLEDIFENHEAGLDIEQRAKEAEISLSRHCLTLYVRL
jgi:hypothetical protein